MDIFQAFFLGLFQGFTEFLPVSSSGHLVLAEHVLHLDAKKLLPFDVILHGGTLVSLFIVFFPEIKELLGVLFAPKKAKKESKSLFFFLLVATLPVIIIGFFVKDSMDAFRTPHAIAGFFLLSAALFILAEKFPQKKQKSFSWKSTILVGVLQVAALFPGISRSGTCTAAAMLGGISREKATRFAFLLGIPVIAGAFVLGVLDIAKGEAGNMPLLFPAIVGFLSSAFFGAVMAKFLLHFFKKHSLYTFAAYLICAAVFSFWVA